MAGHSAWKNIKHRKEKEDAKRGKVFTKLIRELTVAARAGLPDPNSNPRLRLAIDNARAANMPRDTMERAIKRGSGQGDDANYEEIVYEGIGPGGSAIMLEIMTDNRNRTASEIRKIFSKHNGNLGESGSVAWNFNRKGLLTFPLSAGSEEKMMDLSLECGAEDVILAGEEWQVTCDPGDFAAVRDAFVKKGLEPKSATLARIPANTIKLDAHDSEIAMNLMDALEDHDDVQNAFANFELDEGFLKSQDG
ncbi:MAG: putative transcriptional regulatory protein [Myxococcota bacterium]|nr:putative transcriptional regulatory protein [Myxococcota bacterium]